MSDSNTTPPPKDVVTTRTPTPTTPAPKQDGLEENPSEEDVSKNTEQDLPMAEIGEVTASEPQGDSTEKPQPDASDELKAKEEEQTVVVAENEALPEGSTVENLAAHETPKPGTPINEEEPTAPPEEGESQLPTDSAAEPSSSDPDTVVAAVTATVAEDPKYEVIGNEGEQSTPPIAETKAVTPEPSESVPQTPQLSEKGMLQHLHY